MLIDPLTSHTPDSSILDHKTPLRPAQIDRILTRASCLPPHEQALLQAIYTDGQTSRELAAIAGTNARAVRRQSRRIAARVLSPIFTFVLSHRDSWCPTTRRIATCIVLHGHSMRAASELLDISLHTVRRHYHAVLAMFEASTSP